MKTNLLFFVLIPLAALSMGNAGKGCGANTNDEEELSTDLKALAEDVGETSGAADAATALVSIPLLALTSSAKVTTAEGTAETASQVETWFKPAGCVTTTTVGVVTTYTFNGCTGPLGLVGVNGELVATFSLVAGGLSANIQSEGLTLNKTPVEQSAVATLTFEGSLRKVTWDGGYKGQTHNKGLPIEHNANYTTEVDTDTGCVKWSGNGSTTIDGRGLTVTVAGYERCGSLWVCPKAGTISATGVQSGLSLTLDYLGGGQARLTSPKGTSWDYKMLWCIAD